jgi:hypothetical protein
MVATGLPTGAGYRGIIAVALCAVGAAAPCHAANALYDLLIQEGVKVSPQVTLTLPKPAVEDGLSPDAQRQAIESLLAGRYDWETFTRRSVVAPFLLKVSEGAAESGPIGRRVDLYFVAYGDLTALGRDNFLQDRLNLAPESDETEAGGKAHTLTIDELHQRGIDSSQEPDDPRWVAVTSTLLGKVRISLTTRSLTTATGESYLVASIADPRFENDVQYPNCWRSLSVDDAGQRQVSGPQPYAGMGSYAKATRLTEPAGAIFVEYHIAFVEPHGWFHGTNLLRSKLPIVTQDMVRKFRRRLGG